MEPKDMALDFLSNAEDFIVLTNDYIVADAQYPIIEKMLLAACQQPQIREAVIQTAQKIVRNEMLAMLN